MARSNEPDLSAVLAKLEELTNKVASLEQENARLRSGGSSQDRVLTTLAERALKDARMDPPDLTPEIRIEVAFAPTSMVVGRGRILDKMDGEPLGEEDSQGFPPGLFKRATLTIHESELPAFEALTEKAGPEELARVHAEMAFHEALFEEGRINELEGRHYLPSFSAAYRRELKRGMQPLLYVKQIDAN